ncbi:hypothetical protein ILYODFUR_020929 [Ilyodon furcidens]|uniref:Uncharacterized protein n=1 Tax=Ilyodon furcidens TaxID=33524 RepID=A0ABV0SYU5_9TELE
MAARLTFAKFHFNQQNVLRNNETKDLLGENEDLTVRHGGGWFMFWAPFSYRTDFELCCKPKYFGFGKSNSEKKMFFFLPVIKGFRTNNSLHFWSIYTSTKSM